MRLLQIGANGELTLTNDLECRDIPPYAILSHTWGSEEFTFEDLKKRKWSDKEGYHKILSFVQHARRDGFEYFWVDTCCIDKASHTELSLAINSMFNWYRIAGKCYVYLADVQAGGVPESIWKSDFRRCRWFTRGWTLQELVAAQRICVFYDREWREIGDHTSLQDEISQISGIDQRYLNGAAAALSAPISMKMRWLARRKPNGEDIAYCVMGLFDIEIPILYGEGEENAFLRLQEAVLRKHNDPDIFAWYWSPDLPDSWSSIFAPSPGYFQPGRASSPLCTSDSRWRHNALRTRSNTIRQFLLGYGFITLKDVDPKSKTATWSDAIGRRTIDVLSRNDDLVESPIEDDDSSLGDSELYGDFESSGMIMTEQEGPIKAIPKYLGVSTNLEDTTGTDPNNEEQDATSEVESIFSYGESSISTVSSVSINPIQSSGVRELTQALLGEDEFRRLCTTAVRDLSQSKVRGHIKGFLRDYGANLIRQNSSAVQAQAAVFVQQLAGRLADEIRWAIRPANEIREPFKKEEKRDLESWLAEISTEGPTTADIRTSLHPEQDDVLDEDSDDDANQAVQFPNITEVREFLVSSDAFQLLLQNLRTWLKIGGENQRQQSKHVEMEANSILTKSKPEQEIPQQDGEGATLHHSDVKDLMVDDRDQIEQPLRRNEDVVNIVSNPSSFNVPRLNDSETTAKLSAVNADSSTAMSNEAPKPDEQHLEGHETTLQSTSRLGMRAPLRGLYKLYVHWNSFSFDSVADLFRPNVQPGFERLHWRCSCNTTLWADFPKGDPSGSDYLQHELSRMSDPSKLASNTTYPQAPVLGPGASSIAGSGAASEPERTGYEQPSGPARNPPSNGSPQDSLTYLDGSHAIDMARMRDYQYFEVCVGTKHYAVNHYELDISAVEADGRLFQLIWDSYNKSRVENIGRLFLRPTDVHFVKFSISKDQYSAGIHARPHEYPPDEEISLKRYHYLAPKVIMPTHLFLHYLHRGRQHRWDQHAENIWLKRLPRKLQKSLELESKVDTSPDLVFGWGIHIINGPDHTMLSLLLAAGITITFTISIAILGVANTQEQAFGVGSYFVAVLACVMAAIYFKLADQ